MSQVTITRGRLLGAAALLVLAAGGIGFTVAQHWEGSHDGASAKPAARKILYWYDPMIPAEHHDGPGLSSMGMQTIPRYGVLVTAVQKVPLSKLLKHSDKSRDKIVTD